MSEHFAANILLLVEFVGRISHKQFVVFFLPHSMHKYHCIIVWILLLKSFLNPAYSAILVSSHTAHCAQKCRLCTLVHGFCISRKGGTGGGGWDYLQGAMSWKLLSFAVKGT